MKRFSTPKMTRAGKNTAIRLRLRAMEPRKEMAHTAVSRPAAMLATLEYSSAESPSNEGSYAPPTVRNSSQTGMATRATTR